MDQPIIFDNDEIANLTWSERLSWDQYVRLCAEQKELGNFIANSLKPHEDARQCELLFVQNLAVKGLLEILHRQLMLAKVAVNHRPGYQRLRQGRQ